MSYKNPITFMDTLNNRPQMGSTPKEYRDICNILIDHGWTFVEGMKGKKHKLYPADRRHRYMTVPNTPSSHGSFMVFLNNVRKRGGQIDENGNSLYDDSKSPAEHDFEEALRKVIRDPDLQPMSTLGNRWWAPESEPEPEPEPEPVVAKVVRLAPREDHDRQSTTHTLGQARTLLRQGYHVNRVVAKTGWGRNWFNDIIDETGYVKL